jgi:hypothetical protein
MLHVIYGPAAAAEWLIVIIIIIIIIILSNSSPFQLSLKLYPSFPPISEPRSVPLYLRVLIHRQFASLCSPISSSFCSASLACPTYLIFFIPCIIIICFVFIYHLFSHYPPSVTSVYL